MKTFDPNENPYADDLLRLSLAPPGRYSRMERLAMACIIASKLYRGLSDDFFVSSEDGCIFWRHRFLPNRIRLATLFEDDVESHGLLIDNVFRWTEFTIVLYVGSNGVIEIFNDAAGGSIPHDVMAAYKQIRAGEYVEAFDRPGAVPYRPDGEAASDYEGNRDAQVRRRDRDDYRNGNGRGGAGGGGSNGGNGNAGKIPGSGGVGELINHPVLLSVEQDMFDSIMEQV